MKAWRLRLVASSLVAMMALGSLVTSCGDDSEDGPKDPLWIGATFAMQPDNSVLVVVSLATSLSPMTLVDDATVSVNGTSIPKYQGGFMYTGPIDATPGEPVTLTVKRGITITSTVILPGKVVITSPAGGETFDPQQPIAVEWTAPSVLPDQYYLWISDDFTESILGWSDTVGTSQTAAEIGAGELKPGQSGIVVIIQSDVETTAFEGDSLPDSYFRVSNHAESDAFSTQ